MTGSGTLLNEGTINQTGLASFMIDDSTNVDNVPYNDQAFYDFQTDSTIGCDAGHSAGSFSNSGTIEKTSGTGTSSILIPLTDSGTVEALSGTLSVSDASNLSAGTLRGGTWIAGSNSTLNLNGNITTLDATATLQGPGATLTGLSNLSQIDEGSNLELQDGASLSTVGSLSSVDGTLTRPGP